MKTGKLMQRRRCLLGGKYSSQQYVRCAQGYSVGIITSMVVATSVYVHTPEYEYGYKLGKQYTLTERIIH
ncbi:MAG: hypothetical protein WA667_05860 [Candidatus Nitrosopolaris sp.]